MIRGIIPPMVTPFREDDSVDIEAFRGEVDHLIELGVHGLAVGGSTGEGHTLSDEESLELTRAAIDVSAGRVPIIAGIIVDSTQQAVKRGKALKGLDVAALQITPVHYLFTPDEHAMYDFYSGIASEVGIPIIIYNVVPWAYATPSLLTKRISEIKENLLEAFGILCKDTICVVFTPNRVNHFEGEVPIEAPLIQQA